MGRRRVAAALLVSALLVGCSSDESEPPAATDEVEDGGGEGAGGDTVIGEGSTGGGGVSLFSSGLSDAGGLAASTLGTGVPGLTVRKAVTRAAAADRAWVVVVPEGAGFGPGGPEAISTEDRRRVREAVAALDIDPAAVSFGPGREYEGGRIAVPIAVGEAGAGGPQVVEAVETAVGRSQASGVALAVSDCGPVLTELRRQGFAAAEAEARAWAESSSVRPGAIVAASARTTAPGSEVFDRLDPCQGASDPGQTAAVQPFDAAPEVAVTLELAVTYALGPERAADAGAHVTVVGSGTAKAKADEAYVVVVAGSDEEGNARPLTRKDREALLAAVTRLGHDRKDVDMVTSEDASGTVVQVDVEVGDVAKAGPAIVDAVEEVLGDAQLEGVRFGREDCGAQLARARKDAAADGRARASVLAESAGVRLGELRAVVDLGSPSGGPLCSDDVEELFASDPYGPDLDTFDAEPDFALTTRTALGYAIAR